MTVPRNVHWRNGLGAASFSERLVILECEHRARSEAIQEWYLARLKETRSLIVDAHDLDVRGASTIWGRGQGNLYLRITVYGRSAGRIRSFRWCRTMRIYTPGGVGRRIKGAIDKGGYPR